MRCSIQKPMGPDSSRVPHSNLGRGNPMGEMWERFIRLGHGLKACRNLTGRFLVETATVA